MRTTLLILALLSIHILCFSQAQQKVSTITVKVKNPREGKYIIVRYLDYKDSVMMKQNQEIYTLKGTISDDNEECLYTLLIDNNTICFNIYTEDITVRWDLNNTFTKPYYSNYNDSIDGSITTSQCLFSNVYCYNTYFSKQNMLRDSLLFISDKEKILKIQKQIDSITYEYEMYVIKDIFKTASKQLVKYYLMDITDSPRSQNYQWVVDSIQKKYISSPGITRRVRNYYRKLDYVNQTAKEKIEITNLSLPDKKGKKHDINLLNSGNYIIVDFWASWCTPCRKSIPEMKRLYENYKTNNLKFVTISIDKNREDWLKALKDEKMDNFLNVWDSEQIAAKLYKVNAVPFTFLVSPTGKVIDSNLEAWQWNVLLNSIFQAK